MKQHGLEACSEVGWHDRIEAVLRHAMVFVSLQATDNYPSQAVLEAMACGTAVVATDVGQTRRLIDDEVGKVASPSCESVAEAVIDLLENPGMAIEKGQRGRQRVLQQHSTDVYLDYLERLYRDLSQERIGKA